VHFRTKQQKPPEVSIPYGGHVIAARELRKYTGKPIRATICKEAACGHPNRYYCPPRLVPVVNVCMAERPVPDEQETIPAAMGMPLERSVLVSQWYDIVIIKKAADPFRFEDSLGDWRRQAATIFFLPGCNDVRPGCQVHHDLGALTQASMLRAGRHGKRWPKIKTRYTPYRSVHGYKLFYGVVGECYTRRDRVSVGT